MIAEYAKCAWCEAEGHSVNGSQWVRTPIGLRAMCLEHFKTVTVTEKTFLGRTTNETDSIPGSKK